MSYLDKNDFQDEEVLDLSYDDDETESESEVQEIPKEVRKLRTQSYDKSVKDTVGMIEDGDIILDPDYQRNYVWDNKKASLLVESILINVPIPLIYVSEEENGEWSVVDGLQRLNSLSRYYNGDFKLSGLEVLTELNGLKYEQLNSKAQRVLNSGNLRIVTISYESHQEIKYDVFMRLNRGSVKLKEQELRNCLYRGSFNDFLKKIAKNKEFLQILKLKEPHKRFDDIELVLRYLALSDNYDIEKGEVLNYKATMKSFLNYYMDLNKKTNDLRMSAFSDKFNDTIFKVVSVFGMNAFRKPYIEDGNIMYENNVNRALMDCIMVGFEFFSQDILIKNKETIIFLLANLLKNDEKFESAITLGTSDKRKINYRINTFINTLKEGLSHVR